MLMRGAVADSVGVSEIAGGDSSHLWYTSGVVTAIYAESDSFRMVPDKEQGDLLTDSVVVNCSNMAGSQYSFSDVDEGDVVTLSHVGPINGSSVIANSIEDIEKCNGGFEMAIGGENVTRRCLLKGGALGLAGLFATSIGLPKQALAQGAFDCERRVPMISVTVFDPNSRAILTSYESALDPLTASQRGNENRNVVSLEKCGYAVESGVSLYTAEAKIPVSMSEYVEEEKESDESLGVYVRVVLGVMWGEGKNTIQIQRGTLSVSQRSPFVNYSNVSYAIMQKDRYLAESFNGQEKTVETGWPVDSFNVETDQYTCGGAVIGMGFNLLTGETFNYAVEIYL